MKKILLGFVSLCLSLYAVAQDSAAHNADRQATGLRADGKIYVVLAVSLTILLGLFLYIIRLDKKITRLEQSNSH